MKIDENEFFRQATLRICGNLNIGQAMLEFIDFVRPYIPVSEIALTRSEPDFSVIRSLVAVSPSGKIINRGEFTPAPQTRELLLRESERWAREGRITERENNPENNPLAATYLSFFKTKDPSAILMLLAISGVPIGNVGIIAEGHGTLTREHERLFALLREPFSIAMANAMRFQEVLQLKKMVDQENRELSRELLSISGDEIIGADKGLAGVMEMVRQVAPLASPVMLLGETGVGKEVFANAIHRLSVRSDAPFIKVNCGAIPENLVDAELFGHEKGAFTGAHSQKRGRFERAHQGTIFLDEIGELPLPAQVRLLRVLQNKEIERVGGVQTIPVDVRVISATNKNLEAMVQAGTFREDLWYRLNIFPITIPPLRRHAEDIPDLVRYFAARKARELKMHSMPKIPKASMENMLTYTWPGNVRELENMIERLLILSRGKNVNPLIDIERLPKALKSKPEMKPELSAPQSLSLDEANTRLILDALRQTGGRIHGPQGAAVLLKINPETLRSRMRKLGIKARKTWEAE